MTVVMEAAVEAAVIVEEGVGAVVVEEQPAIIMADKQQQGGSDNSMEVVVAVPVIWLQPLHQLHKQLVQMVQSQMLMVNVLHQHD